MIIAHIRRGPHRRLKGTLVAVKDEALNAVRVGFSLVRKGDNPVKTTGIEIAEARAFKRKDNRVPNGIRHEFTDFLERIAHFRQFDGAHIPTVADFEFSDEKLTHH